MTARIQIQLVIMTSSPNDAERIESHLRNAGHAVQIEWLSDIDGLDVHLPRTDLVLCASEHVPKANLKDVANKCKSQAIGVPVIAMSDTIDVGRTTQAMRAGARDLVSLQQMEHLQAVILREVDNAHMLHKLDELNSRLQQAESRHDNLLQESTEALAYVQEGIHIRVNQSYARLFGFTDLKSVEGLPLMDLIVIEDRPALKKSLRQVMRGQTNKDPMNFRGLNVDGSNFPIGVRFTPTQMDDEDCIEVMMVPNLAAASEVTGETSTKETIEPLAGFTGGTGRQSLYSALDEALKNPNDQASMTAMLFLRVDNMERVEQRIGFDQADKAFNELATFMLQSCSPGDHSFRFSSSEFVIVVNKADKQQLEQTAKALQAAVGSQTFGGKDNPTSLTVSISILPLIGHSDTQEILREARQQTINIQARQGSGIYIESQRDQAASPQQAEKIWLDRIKTALDKNRFRLVYKTIVNLEGESSNYLDSLLRMLGDDDVEIQPLEFVPIAERHGLMFLIDQWVVVQSLLSMSRHHKTEQEFGLFVRLSDNSVQSCDKFMPWLLKQIKGYPIRSDGLFLTFNETGLIDHAAQAKQLFTDLKKLKIRTAISHFGVSPQSMQLLDQLPVDFVRLDSAVIKALVNPKAGERVSETLKKARQKGVRIVAKQVTDAQTMAMLWTLGVHFIEGEYVPRADLRDTLPH